MLLCRWAICSGWWCMFMRALINNFNLVWRYKNRKCRDPSLQTPVLWRNPIVNVDLHQRSWLVLCIILQHFNRRKSSADTPSWRSLTQRQRLFHMRLFTYYRLVTDYQQRWRPEWCFPFKSNEQRHTTECVHRGLTSWRKSSSVKPTVHFVMQCFFALFSYILCVTANCFMTHYSVPTASVGR